MSDNAKKPGARDISDLKARLGLKKGGEAGGRQTTQGIVAPPGTAGRAGYVPPPPGVAPPPGSQPAMPDPTLDPFGAMNAMAAQQAVRAQPEIIVVDHKNVEKVHDRSWGRRMIVIGVIVVMMIVGFALGGINYERKEVGVTISDAKVLHKEFMDVGKKLQNLQNILYTAKEGGDPEHPSYKLLDKQLTENLATVDLGVPEGGDESKFLIYHAHLYTMDPKLIADTLMFYTHIRTLDEKLKEHVRRSQEDLNQAKPDAIKQLGGETNLAAVIRQPPAQNGQPPPKPFIEIVELGRPVCADKQPHADGCGGPPEGIEFRSDPGSPYGTKVLAKDAAALDTVIFLGDNGVLHALMKGSTNTIEEAQYIQRITDIDQLVENLIKDRKDIENRLNTLAQRGKPLAI